MTHDLTGVNFDDALSIVDSKFIYGALNEFNKDHDDRYIPIIIIIQWKLLISYFNLKENGESIAEILFSLTAENIVPEARITAKKFVELFAYGFDNEASDVLMFIQEQVIEKYAFLTGTDKSIEVNQNIILN